MLMKILLLGRVKKRSSHYVWKMAVNEWPEITPEAMVYIDANRKQLYCPRVKAREAEH